VKTVGTPEASSLVPTLSMAWISLLSASGIGGLVGNGTDLLHGHKQAVAFQVTKGLVGYLGSHVATPDLIVGIYEVQDVFESHFPPPSAERLKRG